MLGADVNALRPITVVCPIRRTSVESPMPNPRINWLVIDVEDTHDVVQPTLFPNFACDEEFSVPKFAPSRVILFDPKMVTASASTMREMTGASKLNSEEAVPIPLPTVALFHSFAPYIAGKHVIDVTDDQVAV
jgi:hypothetical protein